ncbi:hypothetical protein BU14_0325s0008 [Porphyra umbilicalis]|uniref:Stress-response A/B barrel domain-containing protein n=1 Tax=Porphyra umbilicalis TaxID=2786 RepID=A0A1X6NYY0_PORUM|nr:hypothetical protein BU14_0325s0008 [Porphyra umbilicalis]|eukprot:OSX73829.1 hypothetical protein BU14_0325s0008 [Porphyra umbilicalis]
MALPPPPSGDTPLAPYRHIVLFRFANDASPAAIANLKTAFRALVTSLGALVLTFEAGVNVNDEGLDGGLTDIFFMSFADAASFEAYKMHPEHVAFVKSLEGVVAQATVLDWTSSA